MRLVFSLVRGSVDTVNGRFAGDGNFAGSPNLAGSQGGSGRRGAIDVIVTGLPGGETSTSSFDRSTPLPYTVLSNDSAVAAFAVTLGDAPTPHLSATFVFSLSAADPRRFTVNATTTTVSGISPRVVALSSSWVPPNVIGWFNRGVRQGMAMSNQYIASKSALNRFYAIGDGPTGAVEVLTLATASPLSWMYSGSSGSGGTRGGVGLVLWGDLTPLDTWTGFPDGGTPAPIAANTTSASISLAFYPNDLPFPPSRVPAFGLPPRVIVDDLRSVLQAAHGAVVAALHSYDFSPEVRAAPCLVHSGNQCYAPLYNVRVLPPYDATGLNSTCSGSQLRSL